MLIEFICCILTRFITIYELFPGLKDNSKAYLIDFGIAVRYMCVDMNDDDDDDLLIILKLFFFELINYYNTLQSFSMPGTGAISYAEDPKKAHDGTLVYTSIDAHRVSMVWCRVRISLTFDISIDYFNYRVKTIQYNNTNPGSAGLSSR